MTPKEFSEKVSELRLAAFLAGYQDAKGESKATEKFHKFDNQAELLEIELIAEFDRLSEISWKYEELSK